MGSSQIAISHILPHNSSCRLSGQEYSVALITFFPSSRACAGRGATADARIFLKEKKEAFHIRNQQKTHSANSQPRVRARQTRMLSIESAIPGKPPSYLRHLIFVLVTISDGFNYRRSLVSSMALTRVDMASRMEARFALGRAASKLSNFEWRASASLCAAACPDGVN